MSAPSQVSHPLHIQMGQPLLLLLDNIKHPAQVALLLCRLQATAVLPHFPRPRLLLETLSPTLHLLKAHRAFICLDSVLQNILPDR